MTILAFVALAVSFAAYGYAFQRQAGWLNMLTKMSIGVVIVVVSFVFNAGSAPAATLNASLGVSYALLAILIVTRGHPIDFGDLWAWNDMRKVPLPHTTRDDRHRHIRRTGIQFLGCWAALSLTIIPLALFGY